MEWTDVGRRDVIKIASSVATHLLHVGCTF